MMLAYLTWELKKNRHGDSIFWGTLGLIRGKRKKPISNKQKPKGFQGGKDL